MAFTGKATQPVLGTPGATRQQVAAERPLTDAERGHLPADPRQVSAFLRTYLDEVIEDGNAELDDHALLVAARAALDPEE
jgi:hypothetical protein